MRRAALALAVALAACHHGDPGERMDEYHRFLDHHVGDATEEDIAEAWGPPTSRETIGVTDYWTYLRPQRNPARYDRVVMQFRGGRLQEWTAEIRR